MYSLLLGQKKKYYGSMVVCSQSECSDHEGSCDLSQHVPKLSAQLFQKITSSRVLIVGFGPFCLFLTTTAIFKLIAV